MSKKSLMTPQERRSMLGFGSAAAKLKQQHKKVPEQKRLTFSANRSRLQASTVGSKRYLQTFRVSDCVAFILSPGYYYFALPVDECTFCTV